VRKLLFLIASLILLSVGAFFIAWDRFASFLASPGGRSGEERIVVVPVGATPAIVAELLVHEGLVENIDFLSLYVDHFAKELTIRPGEYQLSAQMSPVEMLRRISAGKVVTYSIAIPPGADALEIAKLLAAQKLGEEKQLAAAAFDRQIADQLGVPSFSLEGYLFPDAYDLPRNLPASVLLTALVQRYKKVVLEGVINAARAHNLTENEMVTLASIIEKANVIPSERRLYSALLHNRLRERVALESPASVGYGLRRLGLTPEQATKKQVDHPWNTELNLGLPPTPICSPSLASIVAAAEPAQSRALYWVARRDGTHVFCEDEECYRAAMKEWQPDYRPPRKKKR
jgi:peptidoglycan lytic transglycosylase G